jgi:hypothetical protein
MSNNINSQSHNNANHSVKSNKITKTKKHNSREEIKREVELDGQEINLSNGDHIGELWEENKLVKGTYSPPGSVDSGTNTPEGDEHNKRGLGNSQELLIEPPLVIDQEGFQTVDKSQGKGKNKNKKKNQQKSPRCEKYLPCDEYNSDTVYSDVYQSKHTKP